MHNAMSRHTTFLLQCPDTARATHRTKQPKLFGMQSDIQGLAYVRDFLTTEAQTTLLSHIDSQTWSSELSRRVQHYGARYDYTERNVRFDNAAPFPVWLTALADKVRARQNGQCPVFDQAIINEYLPGQGIALHTDRNCFGPVVATVSLGCDIDMDFVHPRGDNKSCRLETGSLLVLRDAARWRWQHGIAKRQSDRNSAGVRVKRERRVSVTFRSVLR